MIHGTKAVIRSHQGFADDESLLSVQSVEHEGGRALLTLSVHEEAFFVIKNLLQDAISVLNWVGTQNRVKKAIQKAHDPAEQQKRQDEYLKYSKSVLSKFDDFVASGLSTREAIKRTKGLIVERGGSLTCHMIEIMIANRKRLQKGRKK